MYESNYKICCRLCIEDDFIHLRDIFYTGPNEELVEKIYNVTGIKICPNDRISTFLCDKCSFMIKTFNDFKTKCWKNQHVLKSWLTDVDMREHFRQANDGFKEEPCVVLPPMITIPTVSNHQEHVVLQLMVSPPMTPFDVDSPQFRPQTETHEIIEEIIETDVEETVATESEPEQETNHKELEQNQFVEVFDDFNSESEKDEVLEEIPRDLDAQYFITEPMTKTELQYTQTIELIYSQLISLRCFCKNYYYRTKKSLHCHKQKGCSKAWLPVYTCNNCFTTLSDSSSYGKHYLVCRKQKYELINKIANKDERGTNKHRSYQMFACQMCDSNFRVFEEYLDHASIHFPQDRLAICLCGKHFTTLKELQQHMLDPCILQYSCDICCNATRTYFESFEEFKQHCSLRHDNQPLSEIKVSPYFVIYDPSTHSPRNSMAACNICGQHYTSVEALDTHRTSHLKLNLVRDPQTNTFISNRQLLDDNDKNGNRGLLDASLLSTECPFCNAALKSVRGLSIHIGRVHKECDPQRVNGSASQSLPIEDAIENPIDDNNENNDNEVRLVCEYCGDIFGNADDLNVHLQYIHVFEFTEEVPYKKMKMTPKPQKDDS